MRVRALLLSMWALAAAAAAFPVWPSPATFEGTIAIPALNSTRDLLWYYDAERSSWRQDLSGPDGVLTYIVTGGSFYRVGRDGNCTVSPAPRFALGADQFAAFSFVGEEVVGAPGVAVSHWVGTFAGYDGAGGWAQDVYCDGGAGAAPCRLRRLVNIDEPGWHTEVKTFRAVTAGVPPGAFRPPPQCAGGAAAAAQCSGTPRALNGRLCASTTRYTVTGKGSCGCGNATAPFPWAYTSLTAASSRYLFNSSGMWCGKVCGKCFELTPTGFSPSGSGTEDLTPKTVMVTNGCGGDHNNYKWCTKEPGQLNDYGYLAHFDLADNDNHVERMGWGNPEVVYEEVPCSDQQQQWYADCECSKA